MAAAREFPPAKVGALAAEVVALLKDRKETVSVAETVRFVNASKRPLCPDETPPCRLGVCFQDGASKLQ